MEREQDARYAADSWQDLIEEHLRKITADLERLSAGAGTASAEAGQLQICLRFARCPVLLVA